ncbi:MAG: hypothetical protein CL678_13180 [Bdellovibrionaceae bacterium]|nr:hypothetical protein [Pseudobdellovibrionaceae bacterium]|tara:strand:+ start:2243 stop:3514 length:1272 start_codon:yes stop_codon:yes gene_type:complete
MKNLFNKEDFLASFVLLVIGIPISIGIGMAAGASPAAGLVSAIVGGIFVGIFSGGTLMISGPSASLILITYEVISRSGSDGLAIMLVIGGIFQVILGSLRVGWVFKLVSPLVLKGMLSAIGLIIAFSQLHVLFGGVPPSSPFQALIELPQVVSLSVGAVLGGLAIFIEILWEKKFQKWIPGSLAAVILVTAISQFWVTERLDVQPLILYMKESLLRVPDWRPNHFLEVLGLAFAFSIIGCSESLLTARAVDILRKKRNEDDDVEPSRLDTILKAHGFGNMICGVLGGFPITGVIIRSAANVQAGARSWQSGVLQGLWILSFVSLVPWLLDLIPTTVLAAILIVTGFKIVRFEILFSLLRKKPTIAAVWLGTTVGILGLGLLEGLGIGVLISIFVFKKKFFQMIRIAKGDRKSLRWAVSVHLGH